jgi:hypothetical protein
MATNSRTNRRPPVAKPLADTAPRKKALKNNENHAPQASTAGALDELEQKYNIEGCNTLDIVHARIENDAAQGQSYCYSRNTDSPEIQRSLSSRQRT